ncbi:MAG: uroporphyrinogen-III synthase [Rhodobacteraceae bacterium]|nr:uroporphyrinogen-III synthase [Paracoccaceae bacterium]
MARTLLLTRALKQAEGFAELVAQKTDFQCHIAPMQKMQDIPAKIDFSGVDALVFTSQNGVESFVRRWKQGDIPAYCVGPATAEIAKAAGMLSYAAQGNSASLTDLIKNAAVQNPLHIHGQHKSGGLAIDRHVMIYDQVALPLATATAQLLADGEINAVALFSPRSAQLLADVWEANWPAAEFFCISQATALPVEKLGKIHVSAEPSAESLLTLLQN